MRWIVVAFCLLSLAPPAAATLPAGTGFGSRAATGHHSPEQGARPDILKAETSANGVGWKQFVTLSDRAGPGRDPAHVNLVQELTSWALMVSAIGLAGSLLRRAPLRKS
jgi:hypothetical protein